MAVRYWREIQGWLIIPRETWDSVLAEDFRNSSGSATAVFDLT